MQTPTLKFLFRCSSSSRMAAMFPHLAFTPIHQCPGKGHTTAAAIKPAAARVTRIQTIPNTAFLLPNKCANQKLPTFISMANDYLSKTECSAARDVPPTAGPRAITLQLMTTTANATKKLVASPATSQQGTLINAADGTRWHIWHSGCMTVDCLK